MPLVQPVTFRSWSHLREHLRDRPGALFRGQRSTAWRLATSLEREVDRVHRAQVELSLLVEFRMAAPAYLPGGPVPDTDGGWLALMHHHGAPTRLLAFTKSPYVGAYFAVERLRPGDTAAVWEIDELWCTRAAAKPLGADPADLTKVLRAAHAWMHGAVLTRIFRGVVSASPTPTAARRVSQQTAFLVPGDVRLDFEDNLEGSAGEAKDLKEHVRCYAVPAAWRGEILHDLLLMNISRATLFPGLEGFAQSLKYGLVREDPIRRAIRLAMPAPGTR